MLHLERIEISGFKSFVDPVQAHFSSGITAIVGPNGCGKSNLSEAITWVLGEQSAKTLRGGKMEDVIFSGTERRKALGMAEVGLTLYTDQELPQAEDGRLQIGRRVFRSGESQYTLNGRVVRLKTIRDLLMDTGLGIRAYSVIEQGRIGMILSGKPQDRRRLIEEAAGITRYKVRKRAAELKLEEASANLLRLNDIISEVERALRSLKRQSNAARRYQEREKEVRELLHRVLVGRWLVLDDELKEVDAALSAEGQREAEGSATLLRTEATLTAARQHLDELNSELANRHRRQSEYATTIEGRQQYLRGARQTLSEIGERLDNGDQVARQREVELKTHLEALEALDSRRTDLLSERDEARAAVANDQIQIDAAHKALSAQEARVETVRTQILASVNRVSAIQGRLHSLDLEGERMGYRRDHLERELEERQSQLDAARSEHGESQGHVERLQQTIDSRSEDRRGVAAELEEVLHREAQVTTETAQCEREHHALQQRQTLLEELAEEDVERRAKLRRALDELGLEQSRFLDDVVTARQGWEQSLDLFFEQMKDAVLLSADEDPLTAARSLARSGVSASLLRPADPADLRVAVDGLEPQDDAIVSDLATALNLPAEFQRSLPPAFLVERPEDAERLAQRYPGIPFLSRERLWAESGLLRVQAEQAGPGLLARNRELQDIQQRVPELEHRLLELDERLSDLVDQRTELAARSRQLDAEIATRQQELAVAMARRQDASHRVAALTAQHAALTEEHKEIGLEIDRLDQRQTETQNELKSAQQAHRALDERFDEAQTEAEAARAQREALRTAGAGRRGRLELLDERLQAHSSETRRLSQQRQEVEQHLERWVEERGILQNRIKELQTGIDEAERELQLALERRQQAEESTTAGQEQLLEQRQTVTQLEQRVNESREHRDTIRTAIEEQRVKKARLEGEKEHLAEDFRRAFKEELPQELASIREELDAEALPALREELAGKQERLERMGPVNVLAAKEYDEQVERHTFLIEQREDVVQSVDSLRRTIREINQTSSERFMSTLVEVNERFGTTFARLFRGGEASMRLLDEEDPLESGIEINARPPGKRLQNIMLLSGGEKALTAIALLFALFGTKPSPFCILDEVDAPLDDANVLRFVHLLQEMSLETQFLIITHNKLTMQAAASLYGVTMEEKGISRLVGVSIDDLHPETQLAS